MLKIGLISGEFPPMEGGVGAFTQELGRALAGLGHEIHVITSRKARPPMADREWRRLRKPVERQYGRLHPFIHRWRWPSLGRIADIVRREELDVINVQYQAAAYNMTSPAVTLLPWRMKGLVKTAVTFHDLRVPYLFPKAGPLRRFLVRFMARQAHGVIVTNQADYQSLADTLDSPIRQIPIGSNIDVYQPHQIEIAEARELLGVVGTDCLLGYFGFLNETKGADTLLRGLAQLDANYHLVFIGGQTGSSDNNNNIIFLEQIKQLVADLGLTDRVHWTGFVSEKRVSTFLYAADMMVMPYRDGVSLRRGTLMAVLAHGRPLVTTAPDTPIPELCHRQNAYFVPPDDADVLATAVRTMASDPQLRQKLGAEAVQVADLFTWDKIAAETADFLEALVASSKGQVV